jgi:transcriptional regulator with XRE-family HTH domain
MLSNKLENQYMQILAQCKDRRAECFTQKEVAELLKVSLRKYVDFENGKSIDFGILDNLAGLVCYKLSISII